VVGVVVAVTAALLSPVFRIRHVRVDGLPQSLAAEVERSARPLVGQPLVFADTAGVVATILKDPRVARARIDKEPPGTVRVVAARRVPVAQGAVPGGWALLAGDGIEVESVTAAIAGLPQLFADGLPHAAGERATTALPTLAAAVALPPGVSSRVVQLKVGSDGTLVIILEGNIPVLFGRPEDDAARKGQVLEALLSQIAARGWQVSSINVVSPDAPAVTPVGPAAGN
jgi:cell division protein FtsQ